MFSHLITTTLNRKHIPIKMVESLQHSDTENTSSIQRRNISGAQPRPCDVILGRGKRYQNNPGNILFQGTIGRINISIVKFVLFTHTLVPNIFFIIQILSDFIDFATWELLSRSNERSLRQSCKLLGVRMVDLFR
jgi:hypothetical protein